MPEEEKTQDQVEEQAWEEATEEEKNVDTDENPEVEAEEEDQEGAEEAEEAEESEEKKKETDWEADKQNLQNQLDAKTKEAEANKKLADDLLKEKAAEEKKKAEEQEAAPEKMPEEVEEYFEEDIRRKQAIEYSARQIAKGIVDDTVKKALDEYDASLVSAMGGKDPKTFIGEMVEKVNQTEFNQDVTYGYVDKEGKYHEGHADAMEIVRSQAFWDWAEEQAKKDPTFAERQNYAAEAIKIISSYKKEKLSNAAEKEKKGQQKEKEEMEEGMSGVDTTVTKKTTKKTPDKYDEEQAARDAGFTI